MLNHIYPNNHLNAWKSMGHGKLPACTACWNEPGAVCAFSGDSYRRLWIQIHDYTVKDRTGNIRYTKKKHFENPFANVLHSTFHSFIPALAQLQYIPIFPAALLVADGVHVVGPCHVGPQALGCFIGHLDPILQDRHGKPQCRKFYGSEPRECLRMISGSNSNIKLVFVLWLKSNYTYIYIYLCAYK